MLMISIVLIFYCGSLFAQTESADSVSFQKVVAKSPEPGMIFLYPERIKLKEGGFFNADRVGKIYGKNSLDARDCH